MPTVRIGRERLEVEPGERLLDALDDALSRAIPWSCRDASCGTCRVAVPEGEAALVPADAVETATLRSLGAAPGQRLACRLRLRDDAAGDLVLEPVTRR